MSDGTELIVMPECDGPSSFGEQAAASVAYYEERVNEARNKFALWDSLDQATKDKLDQLTGYKPL